MNIKLVSEVSIDGKITFGEGESSKDLFSFLSEDDMKFIHSIRGEVDGILVGMNTIRNDNPSLTCRYVDAKNPIRVVPSNTMEIPEDSTILNDGVETIIITSKKNIEAAKQYDEYSNLSIVFAGEDTIDFKEAFDVLEEKYDIHTIMLEGGGTLNWTLINQDMVNEIVIIRLPIIIGGKNNVSLVDGEGFKKCETTKKYNLKGLEFRSGITIENYVVA